jgi:hypothetical protein
LNVVWFGFSKHYCLLRIDYHDIISLVNTLFKLFNKRIKEMKTLTKKMLLQKLNELRSGLREMETSYSETHNTSAYEGIKWVSARIYEVKDLLNSIGVRA